MKILIADDHLVVREGLKEIVTKVDKVSVVETADNGMEALEKIESCRYDLVILDVSMPGLSGLEVLQTLKRKNIKVNILVLSIFPQAQYAIRALRLGASGYLSKDSVYEELASAIKKISSGGRYISADLVEKYLFGDKKDIESTPHEKLSEREFQIMCLLAKGKSVMEIASEIFLSDKTVSTHRARILEKMGMRKNADLTLYAIRNNLIE
jgi:two-component system, NarL family, invasion response regulator UvrY